MIARLKQILEESGASMPKEIRAELTQLSGETVFKYTEKQVDVRIAVDLVGKALRDECDVAYLLSADGDFVPAVQEVRCLGKQIFAVSASSGQQLSNAVDTFIRLRSDWFHGCYQ